MSTVTPAQVKAMYPEYEPTPDELVQTHIDKCENLVSKTVLGSNWITAVIMRVNVSLSHTQEGQEMRLSSDTGKSVAQDELDDIMLPSGSAYRPV